MSVAVCIFRPKAPSCGPKPANTVYKWVSGLLLQYGNTSFSVDSVIDKEQSMHYDTPTLDNDKSYKSRMTVALQSLIEESNKVADEPLATPPCTTSNVANHLPLSTLHMTLSLLQVNYGTNFSNV